MSGVRAEQRVRRAALAQTGRFAAKRVTECRSCGDPSLQTFLSLGETPIANRLVRPKEPTPDPAFPLEVGHCRSCSLVQLTYELPEGAIFDEEYPYFSSYSETLREHSEHHVERLIEERGLTGDSLVIEVASNDGYLLRNFMRRGIPVLGIEPTPGPAAAAEAAGIPTIRAFFGPELAQDLVREGKRADVVIANNVMAHVPDLNGFVAGLAELVTDDGVVSVENPNVQDLVEHGEFDTIYHEHFCYFSTLAVRAMMDRHGLTLIDVERFPKLHGGTLRWRMSRTQGPSARARERLESEQQAGLAEFKYYAGFGQRVEQIQQELRRILVDLAGGGARIAAYGAAAKGATLLNSSGINADLIEFIVDRNEMKQGRLMPGARIPIRPTEALLEEQPDYTLLLAWNIAEEVMRQQADYFARGGRFIVPVPDPRIV